jgi:hypothetical protein
VKTPVTARSTQPPLKQIIINAASESINSKVQRVKCTARSFRNTNNFITAIYFHSGGLDLLPSTH